MLSQDLRDFVARATSELEESGSIAQPALIVCWLVDFKRQLLALESAAVRRRPHDDSSTEELRKGLALLTAALENGVMGTGHWQEFLDFVGALVADVEALETSDMSEPCLNGKVIDIADARAWRETNEWQRAQGLRELPFQPNGGGAA